MIKLFILFQKLFIWVADKSVVITIIRRTLRSIAVSSAIKHANSMRAKRLGRQQFVIKVANKIRVYERDQINALIRGGWLDKSLSNYITLCKYCIYVTPSASDPKGKKLSKKPSTNKPDGKPL